MPVETSNEPRTVRSDDGDAEKQAAVPWEPERGSRRKRRDALVDATILAR